MPVHVESAISGPFTPNGATTSFPFTFKAISTDEVAVVDENGTTVSSALYTVTLNDSEGGTVTFTIAPLLADYTELYIVSDPAMTQTADFSNTGPSFNPISLTRALDKAAVRDLAIEGRVGRAILAPFGDAGYTLPAIRNSMVLGTDSSGNLTMLAQGSFPPGPAGDLSVHYKVRTPHMHGAAYLDPATATEAQATANTVAMRAFFDFFKDEANARVYVGDWRGKWLVNGTIYAGYHTEGVSQSQQVPRRFIMGDLVVSTGTVGVLDAVLDIAGVRCWWGGACTVHHAGLEGSTTYGNRKFRDAVRMRMTAGSVFGDFFASCSKRHLVNIDSLQNAGFTMNGITFPNANCIATTLGNIHGRAYGSQHLSDFACPSTAISAKSHGGVTGLQYTTAETFAAGTASYVNTARQRTRLTVGSTADMEAYDQIKTRHELRAATYGTIAFNNGASTIVWTAGDPALTLQVGDIHPIAATGSNAYREYRIVSFGGTSNRTITVTPAPVTEVASATLELNGYWEFFTISKAESATSVLVYPWVPDRNNSAAYLVKGAALAIYGSDSANVVARVVKGLVGGHIYWGNSLYAPHIGTLLGDYAEIGARLSVPGESANHIGIKIDHGHLEACTVSILSHSTNVTGSISIESLLELSKAHGNGARATTNEQVPASLEPLGLLTLVHNGAVFTSPENFINEGITGSGFHVTNHPSKREHYTHVDSPTLTVNFDRDAARLFPKHHWARLIWTDTDGSAPDGTLTLNLHGEMVALGWTFAGDMTGTSATIVTPATTVQLELQFLPASKRVAVTRLKSGVTAAAIAAPSGGATVDAEARTVVTSILTALRANGIVTP